MLLCYLNISVRHILIKCGFVCIYSCIFLISFPCRPVSHHRGWEGDVHCCNAERVQHRTCRWSCLRLEGNCCILKGFHFIFSLSFFPLKTLLYFFVLKGSTVDRYANDKELAKEHPVLKVSFALLHWHSHGIFIFPFYLYEHPKLNRTTISRKIKRKSSSALKRGRSFWRSLEKMSR